MKRKQIEEKQTKPVTPPKVEKQPTLKEKISKVVDDYEDKAELKVAVFDLVQRVLYPEQFCPECDDRLFLNGQVYNCLNCGYSRQFTSQAPRVNPTPSQTPNPVARPTGAVPPQVEKAIAEAEKSMDERRAVPSAKGARIRQLAEQMGDSTVPPTKQDEEILKGSDPNVREVNWV